MFICLNLVGFKKYCLLLAIIFILILLKFIWIMNKAEIEIDNSDW
jgi:hypothetical protein